MAHVWLARALGLAGFEKLVVLKTILPALAENAQFTEMFINEGRLAAMLNHPNCVQIFDLGREGDTLFIAMEYIDGFSLSRVLRRCETSDSPVVIKLVCRIVMDALSGLDYAHHLTARDGRAMNIVHRDISPDNLLVSFTGQTKVVDFGIAKAASEPGRPGGTRTGTVKGKFGYMAPEYLKGEPCDGRADVFAMGVLLYRALTGRKPFAGATDAMTTMAVLTMTPPPPSTFNTLLSKSMDAVIAKALEKDPAQRFESARAMRSAIEAAMPGPADVDAVGAWLQTLWPPGDGERVALESLASGSTEDNSEPALDSVVSEDVDLAFTQSGVTLRTAGGTVSKATPAAAPRSRAPVAAAAAAALLLVAGLVAWRVTRPAPAAEPPPPPLATVAVAPRPAPQPAPPAVEPAPAAAEPEPEAAPVAETSKSSGWLELNATPPVNVAVKGKAVGRTPLKLALPAGRYPVRLTDPNGLDKSLTVVIRAGATTTNNVTFAKGKLDLRVSPWAHVKLDGKPLGTTPVPVQELYEGVHKLELNNPELGKTKKLEVRIAGGETKVVRESLE